MEEDKRFTSVQEEAIYAFKEMESEEEINRKMYAFFSQLVERRRDDPIEGGLQAGIVIFPDKCAMKICENNGSGSHLNAFINLVKYLNNDNRYISLAGTGYFAISAAERKQLTENGVEVRILDGQNELMLAITSEALEKSQYQFEMLNKLLSLCKELKDSKIYDSIKIGLHTPVDEIDFDDLYDEHYENIMRAINSSPTNRP